MTRAHLRVVLAAVVACSPALLGASLAGTSPSDTSHQSVAAQTVPASQQQTATNHNAFSGSVRPAPQQAGDQAVQAREDARKKAEADAAHKKQAHRQKAQDAARKKAAASRSRARKCHAPGQILDLSHMQTMNARAIVRAGRKLHIGRKGQIIALATALQETGLRNYANVNVPVSMRLKHQAVGYDHDSVGLFQQRPIAPWGAGSWGTPKELMTPEISATKFYRALQGIGGWQGLPVTVAAQRVQVSAFPQAYADDAGHAVSIVNSLPCA